MSATAVVPHDAFKAHSLRAKLVAALAASTSRSPTLTPQSKTGGACH